MTQPKPLVLLRCCPGRIKNCGKALPGYGIPRQADASAAFFLFALQVASPSSPVFCWPESGSGFADGEARPGTILRNPTPTGCVMAKPYIGMINVNGLPMASRPIGPALFRLLAGLVIQLFLPTGLAARSVYRS